MALPVVQTSSGHEYKVKDLSQADFGHLEIELAKVEMLGLTACRSEYGPLFTGAASFNDKPPLLEELGINTYSGLIRPPSSLLRFSARILL